MPDPLAGSLTCGRAAIWQARMARAKESEGRFASRHRETLASTEIGGIGSA
jgi:hypothetical protein